MENCGFLPQEGYILRYGMAQSFLRTCSPLGRPNALGDDLRNAITARALRKVYPGTPPVEALGGVDIDIRDNEFFTLLGPSGCGKTTLLRLIAGFEHPTSGTLEMFGESLLDAPPHKRPINTVFQSYALFPHMTVAQNIGFGLEMLGKPKREVEETVSATPSSMTMMPVC